MNPVKTYFQSAVVSIEGHRDFHDGQRVGWNSEAGHVTGRIVKVHTEPFEVNGYKHHATPEEPQYEILSDKSDHHAFHKAGALHHMTTASSESMPAADSADAALAEMHAEKDQAYAERNHLVAALARLYPSGVRPTDIPDWNPEWQNCCYIDLPSGQISYHYHESEKDLFAGLPEYEKPWDGHTKEDVHARLRALYCPF